MSAQGRAVIGFIVGASVFACSPQKAPEAPATKASAQTAEKGAITEQARTQAREIFAGRCTPCHGPTGAGDGAASAGLTPKPRNFQDASWQKSVTDEHIEKIVAYGGAAVGKAPMMPANPDLADNAAVLAALREHVRGLAK